MGSDPIMWRLLLSGSGSLLGEVGEARSRLLGFALRELHQLAQAGRVAKLTQSLLFDLPDAFAGELEMTTYLFEGPFDAVQETETEDQDLFLAFDQGT